MIFIFDLALLLLVSVLLAMKSLYLGAITAVIGLLIGYQNRRVQFLLGVDPKEVSTARKLKAWICAIILGACVSPLAMESEYGAGPGAEGFIPEHMLPAMIVVGLISSAMMAALLVEKRKR